MMFFGKKTDDYPAATSTDSSSSSDSSSSGSTSANKNGKVVVLDCWNGNQKLKEYYTKIGFKYIMDLPEDNLFYFYFSFLIFF